MDVRRLEFLRELADRGTVGAVADAMQITPSAVSQQLRVLEREAGYTLVEPSGRGVVLTAAGEALADTAVEILSAIAAAEGRWREYMSVPEGTVRVATFPTGGEMLLPGLLDRLADTPDVRVEVSGIVDELDFGHLVGDHDVVIADLLPSTDMAQRRRLQVVPLMLEPLDVALPEDHRLAGKATLSPRDVVGETWIGVPRGGPFDTVLEQVIAATGEPVHVAQRVADNGVIEALVAGGHGIAILPRFTTRDRGNGLVTRPMVGIKARRDISALMRPDRFERPSVRVVLQALRAEARKVADAHDAV